MIEVATAVVADGHGHVGRQFMQAAVRLVELHALQHLHQRHVCDFGYVQLCLVKRGVEVVRVRLEVAAVVGEHGGSVNQWLVVGVRVRQLHEFHLRQR